MGIQHVPLTGGSIVTRSFMVSLTALFIVAACPAVGNAAGTGKKDTEAHREHACLSAAASFFRIPEPVLHAIRIVEGGYSGEVTIDTNGTEDFGVMQINSSWLGVLRGYRITRSRLIHNGCLNIFVGGWILARKFARVGAYKKSHPDPVRFWTAVGGYHSWTARLNRQYAQLVYRTMIDNNLILVDSEQK